MISSATHYVAESKAELCDPHYALGHHTSSSPFLGTSGSPGFTSSRSPYYLSECQLVNPAPFNGQSAYGHPYDGYEAFSPSTLIAYSPPVSRENDEHVPEWMSSVSWDQPTAYGAPLVGPGHGLDFNHQGHVDTGDDQMANFYQGLTGEFGRLQSDEGHQGWEGLPIDLDLFAVGNHHPPQTFPRQNSIATHQWALQKFPWQDSVATDEWAPQAFPSQNNIATHQWTSLPTLISQAHSAMVPDDRLYMMDSGGSINAGGDSDENELQALVNSGRRSTKVSPSKQGYNAVESGLNASSNTLSGLIGQECPDDALMKHTDRSATPVHGFNLATDDSVLNQPHESEIDDAFDESPYFSESPDELMHIRGYQRSGHSHQAQAQLASSTQPPIPQSPASGQEPWPTQAAYDYYARSVKSPKEIHEPIAIDKLKQSLSSVPDDYVRLCLMPFDNQIDELKLLHARFRKATRIDFKDMPVCILSLSGKEDRQTSSVLRIMLNCGQFVLTPHMRVFFQRMIRSLLYNHAAFVKQIGETEEFRQAKDREILAWLFEELTSPDDGIPVMEEVRRPLEYTDQREFNPVTKMFIKSLRVQRWKKTASPVSRFLIQTWYKEIGSKKLGYDLGDENKLSEIMHTALQSAHHFPPIVTLPDHCGTPLEIGWLENFQILDLNSFPALPGVTGLEQRLSRCQHKIQQQRLDDTEKSLLVKMKSIIGKKLTQHSSITAFKDKPVAVVTLIRTKPYREVEVLRLMDTDNELISLVDLETRFTELLKSFKFYNNCLLQALNHHFKVDIAEGHAYFLEWLSRELFEPSSSLPVFGFFDDTAKAKAGNHFGAVQSQLADQLALKRTQRVFDQYAISILGYWNKNMQKDVWDSFVKNDYEYWSLIAWVLDQAHSTDGKPRNLRHSYH